ncbi:MAG: PilZ domain-containing protein [Sedimenticola sp.]|uniref:Cyclic diguanosine monophosphate-binding protein n=1 Tax=Sedimenticola thiotaurini TaxID=1543721 RepID=A0A558D421_9GAMM|nr:PilZ domain-containing protein [Sedimenticola sp.]TVT55751.1 MAG: PilZ domain-containing protein [Sedimenticola thiotaurini]MCW8919872.1 PilZ domain-containing protein [Sedimenticola sp.]MCW8947903.1 PilZ domain-containing protein [Sedimenticola sp.]MCW8949924.1 PilZ domain-containing protein [Sedimenticola sp.]
MNTTETDDRRHFHRILFDAPVTLVFADNEFQTKLVDISLNGALLETTEAFSCAPNDRVTLRIQLGDETFIDMEAQITHMDAGRLGLRCVFIDMESIGHLRRLVELNLGNPELLERELSALG